MSEAPWPPPAPDPASLFGACRSSMVPTIASTITIVVVTPTHPICSRRSPFSGGPSSIGAGGLAERHQRVHEEHDDADARSGSE